jgi:hypothetical protein
MEILLIKKRIVRLGVMLLAGMASYAFLVLTVVPTLIAASAAEIQAGRASSATIIEDTEHNRIVFEIEGRPVVVIDAGGLKVDGDIDYGGMLTDVGRGHKAFGETEGEPSQAEHHQ